MNYTFFRYTQSLYEFGKNTNSVGDCVRVILIDCLKFVWRQSGFVFFGALTSVGAFFIFKELIMEEKILIKSETDKKAKRLFIAAIVACYIIAMLMFFLLLLPYSASPYAGYGGGETKLPGLVLIFSKRYYGDNKGMCLRFLIIGLVCFIMFIVLSIIYGAHQKCELQVTEKNIKGKTFFGKEVVLPLYMVSAYATRKYLSTIEITTASGIVRFTMIGNYREIGEVISKKINDRQQKTELLTAKPAETDSLDQLLKLKALLDSGVISQEEFDAKKKQILGL